MFFVRRSLFVLICAVAVLSIGGVTPAADARLAIGFPNYFPPFASTGEIVEIGVLDDARGGETCIVFRADIDGALYFFDGVDSYAPGTRVFVKGNSCTICLVTLTCGQPVSPILNAVSFEI